MGYADQCGDLDRLDNRAQNTNLETLLVALRALVDDLADYVDIEDGEGGPRPNLAMRVTTGLEEIIAKAEGKP